MSSFDDIELSPECYVLELFETNIDKFNNFRSLIKYICKQTRLKSKDIKRILGLNSLGRISLYLKKESAEKIADRLNIDIDLLNKFIYQYSTLNEEEIKKSFMCNINNTSTLSELILKISDQFNCSAEKICPILGLRPKAIAQMGDKCQIRTLKRISDKLNINISILEKFLGRENIFAVQQARYILPLTCEKNEIKEDISDRMKLLRDASIDLLNEQEAKEVIKLFFKIDLPTDKKEIIENTINEILK